MIAFIAPLPCGNAAQIVLHPRAGATHWRLLRRADAPPESATDTLARLAHAGADDSPVDVEVRDGESWHYEVFYPAGDGWVAGGHPATVTIGATYLGTPDHIALIRERLALGLQQYVARGTLVGRRKDGQPSGQIPVLLGPPVFDETPMPVVTIQLSSSSPAERGIGDSLPVEWSPEPGLWAEGSGWFERMSLRIVGWSLNVDERSTLRHAIKTVLAANIQIFYAAGLDQIDISASHTEDFERFGVPVYQAVVDFSALMPFGATWRDDFALNDVDVFADATWSNP